MIVKSEFGAPPTLNQRQLYQSWGHDLRGDNPKFQVIYADPPWKCWSGGNRNASRHYKCMELDAIKALPVGELATEKAALFLWCISPILPDCLSVGEAWGFRYATKVFNWQKMCKNGNPHFGCGKWTRAGSEDCYLFTRGGIQRPEPGHAGVRQSFHSVPGRHSEKPNEFRKRIIQLMGNVPRVELFARDRREGFLVWGDEIEGDIILKGFNPQGDNWRWIIQGGV